MNINDFPGGFPGGEENYKKLIARSKQLTGLFDAFEIMMAVMAPGNGHAAARALLIGAVANLPEKEYQGFCSIVGRLLDEGSAVVSEKLANLKNPSENMTEEDLDPTKLHKKDN
jgi:hypothetical protein